jgi:small subunit ribosomal protein S4
VPLTEKATRVMIRKPYPPGEHGQRRRRAPSEFGKQLLEKQKLKFQYNVSEKQLRSYFKRAKRAKGNPSNRLVQFLETRLDNIVFRSGFAPTIYAARQLVGHGHVMVNGSKVNKPAFEVSHTDIVTLKEKSREIPIVQEAIGKAQVPDYLEVSKEQGSTRITRLPLRDEIPVICDIQLVIELYSR